MTDYVARLLRRTKTGILQLFGQRGGSGDGLPNKQAAATDVKFVPELHVDMEMRQLRLGQQLRQEHELELSQQQEVELELNRGEGVRVPSVRRMSDNNNNSSSSSNSDDEVEYFSYNQQYINRSTRMVDLTQKTQRPPVGFYCK